MSDRRKQNREWATRSDAVMFIAEHEGKNVSGVDALAWLFNSTPVQMRKDADALQAGIIARKQAEVAKLTADLKAASERKSAVAGK